MSWDQKTKYVALISIFKCPSGQVSTCMIAAEDIAMICPSIPNILIGQLQSLHPSIENYCAELYEIFVTNDYIRHSYMNSDVGICKKEHINDGKWFDKWFEPITSIKSVELDKISVPILEKLIKVGMNLSNTLFQRLVDNYQNHSLKTQNEGRNNGLKLVLIAIKSKKMSNGNSANSNSIQSSVLSSIMKKALFHFDEQIRMKGILLKLHYHFFRFDFIIVKLVFAY